jgi:dsDNA-specific endonuclease/ATPase MutS2
LEARAQEAADFKKAIEKKNQEIEALRAAQNRSDLKEVNEAIAGLLQSVEFFKQRLAAQKDTLENLLPQVEDAIGDVLERAKLVKGLPEAGQRLADQPVDSCTIFNRLPAPTPEQKGQIVEVRNSWVGFKVDQRLVIVSPSRIAVYV